MKDLWRLARPFVARRDIPFERAFHRYGGARSWIADRLAFPWDATVLELGYGQGLFTIELASRVSKGRVVGIDMLAGRSTSDLTRSFARRAGVGRRIALLQCDAFHQPFRSGAFDVVASFLALGDIAMSTRSRRFPALACELGRIARPGCRVGLADECFPESRPEGAQGRLFDAMRHHWRNRLPPAARLASILEVARFGDVTVHTFDPRECLPPAHAERELRLGAEWARPQGVQVDFPRFWREVRDIVMTEGRKYPKIVLVTGTKAG